MFQGGLILALATAFLYLRHNRLPSLRIRGRLRAGQSRSDTPSDALGCFAAGCCWGKDHALPWAVTFHNPDAWALTGVPLEMPLHPSQLYEFSTEALLFGFLYWRFGRKHEPGKIIGLYLVLSSVARFLIEFTRFHEQALPFGLPFRSPSGSPSAWRWRARLCWCCPDRRRRISGRPVTPKPEHPALTLGSIAAVLIDVGFYDVCRRRRQRGFVLIAMSVTMLLLLAVIGTGFDLGRIYIARNEAQVFTDAAAMTAAAKLDGTAAGLARARARPWRTCPCGGIWAPSRLPAWWSSSAPMQLTLANHWDRDPKDAWRTDHGPRDRSGQQRRYRVPARRGRTEIVHGPGPQRRCGRIP